MVKRQERAADDRTDNKRTKLDVPNIQAAPEGSESSETTCASTPTSQEAEQGLTDTAKKNKEDAVAPTVVPQSTIKASAEQGLTDTAQKKKEDAVAPTVVPQSTIQASGTVHSIIPLPTDHLLDSTQTAPYEAAFQSRLEQLSVYANESANVYALGKLPPAATWGTYQPGYDYRNVLCDPLKNRPISIWILGHILSSWFVKDGMAVKQAAITLVPLSAELGRQTAKLINGFCVPANATVPNEYGINLIRATTWQSARHDNHPSLFENVFDATEALQSKQAMDHYHVLDLRKDDLVLAECKLTRYRVKDGESNPWPQRAQMELTALSLLHKGLDRTPTIEEGPKEIVDLCI